ncbi:MAG: hypothetical protein MUE40_15820 [Anaerolineae bacterium]|jgi:hypothetical protein|nr:hypothetical protein [Anaerolineae bacterium]
MADKKTPVIIRFLLDVQAEETAFIDVEFGDDKQAKAALKSVLSANGVMIALTNADDMPVLIRTEYVAAAFPVEYDEDEDEEEDDE